MHSSLDSHSSHTFGDRHCSQAHGGLSRCNHNGGHDERHRHRGHGERLGWGREGRGRLEEPLYPSQRGSMVGLMGGMSGLGGIGGMGGLGNLRLGNGGLSGLAGGAMYNRLRGTNRLGPSHIGDRLSESRRNAYLESGPGVSSRLGSRDRYNDQAPFMSGGLHSGMGSRASLGSLSSESSNNLQHLDRRPRQYHYQPPYAEDDLEELMEEEMFRRQEDEMVVRGLVPGDNHDGQIFDDDFFDPRIRRGGL